MKIVNISEAKTNLSKLVAIAYRGEKVVVAKNNLPLVDMVAHKPEGKRKLGLLSGKFITPDNFIDEDMDVNEMFYGSEKWILSLIRTFFFGHCRNQTKSTIQNGHLLKTCQIRFLLVQSALRKS